ncbi:MAG TPA: endopeptidase La [Gammaproteobacteria bacterium]|mgnify:CR=1 FL=1|nr:endopeptidase La [Gammaproteobacteria bacterium]HRA43289.1 endopeptidase La [Gammaproteobacteria bacterium]
MSELTVLPVLPLRDVVVYPHMVIPLFVGRKKSIEALEAAVEKSRHILLTAQKEAVDDSPTEKSLYVIGTIANILQLLKLPDGTIKVLVEGIERGRLIDFVHTEPFFLANVESIPAVAVENQEIEVLIRSLLSQFDQYVKVSNKFSSEVIMSLTGIENPVRLVDTIAAHLPLKIQDKQKILEILNFKDRILELIQMIESEVELMQMEKKISGTVKRQIEKNQREYYLNEKRKAIEKELGDLGDESGGKNDIKELLDKIEAAGMSKEAKIEALKEVEKLKMMSPLAAEANVSRNYIDWMLAVPWKYRTKIRGDLLRAEAILNKDHYGLEKVKERCLEYLAVQLRVPKMKGPLLCLVGPPGVGKTSLGQSLARATGRKFVRMSLGGVRDEAEIRGHRRTYIGALPGKILQKLAKVKVKNPLFLLDEIDKMAMDFRGDPASALLEVLDPEQNHAFNDHYLEVDYDLSDVMFVATANSLNIPLPLLDRMEVIRLSGYIEDEKLHIAEQYLIPKEMIANGLKPKELKITDEAIIDIIRYYTREAGVRSLEREISKICRKVVKDLLLSKSVKEMTVDVDRLEHYLGVRRYRFGQAEAQDQIGQVMGLAWTEAGGELLTIEAMAVPGKGKVTSTGKLGKVMQESIQAAMTVVRSRGNVLGIADDFYEKHDIHVHVPEGATPKDGPSAGITMCTALVSVLTGIPVRKDVAMTGEITLRGQVLPIGGLKEKLLAARRAGILNVIIPDENKPELSEIAKEVYEGMTIHAVHWIDEVLELALTRRPTPSDVKADIPSNSLPVKPITKDQVPPVH